jgi:molybdopterin/thiamine biosynthesis adenylyltransferase
MEKPDELLKLPITPVPLTQEEREAYQWQTSVRHFGEAGQSRLKGATALVSRTGGLGGVVAQQLAAAGVGKLILAHGGNLKPTDLHRQVLMTHDWIGRPRVECAKRSLLELNPRITIDAVPENISDANAEKLIAQADVVFDCAPLFAERYAMNRACVKLGKPMVDAAMFSMEGQITAIVPGKTACLACMVPAEPAEWKREFPVFGAVSATAGAIAAMEGIKLLAGMKPSLVGTLLYFDLGSATFQRVPTVRRADCAVCGADFVTGCNR